LLLRVMEIIQHAGAEIAFPSQTTYLAAHLSDRPSLTVLDRRGRRSTDRVRDEEGVHH
jgi:small-conductance mechanosensitive channel